MNDARIPPRGGKPSIQRERAALTKNAILAAARTIFGRHGFNAARTCDIVTLAGVTRGALYHHFRDKEDLFEAVFEEATADLDRQARASVDAGLGELWDRMRAGFANHLALISDSQEFRQILLIDGPAVLGWKRSREIQSQFIARHTAKALADLAQAGVLPGPPPAMMSNLIQAALNDAAMSIAHSEDAQLCGNEAQTAFSLLLEGIRRRQ